MKSAKLSCKVIQDFVCGMLFKFTQMYSSITVLHVYVFSFENRFKSVNIESVIKFNAPTLTLSFS